MTTTSRRDFLKIATAGGSGGVAGTGGAPNDGTVTTTATGTTTGGHPGATSHRWRGRAVRRRRGRRDTSSSFAG